ncbi:uncharacterized protein LOC130782107 [Actinidia eriantha]|uniref:uncharacterized protein LOC130782107 n=1 Tax=Actinidia eriantha TaxID=165200 RepID=UPI00258686F4|nr:uncharacterized protein LOC130782107 [Actinidia eriantha]
MVCKQMPPLGDKPSLVTFRELKFACLDLEFHNKYVPGGSETIYEHCQRTYFFAVLAIYLQWTEVLSADAFSAFEDEDITYGEEIIDHKHIKCERRINEVIGTTDIVEKGTENVVFRTCHEERNWIVFQMGISDPIRALAAAQIVCKDVAAVDINMGCPKSFSISGGMGAALLTKPGLIAVILTTLRRNLDTPVTCKIRFLKSSLYTVELAWRIEKTCVSALAVHGRRVADRPRDPANWNGITHVVAALSISVIANGDVFEYEGIQRIKESTGATSLMVARGALWKGRRI